MKTKTERFVSPPRDQLHKLRTKLQPGEQLVFDLFDNLLPSQWEIYIQPHMNGLRPDFVLLNPGVGIAVFEVKDWDFAAISRWVEQDDNDNLQLWGRNNEGKQFHIADNPVTKIIQYQNEIYELFCPRLGIRVAEDRRALAVITAGVIFTKASTQHVQGLFQPFIEMYKLNGSNAAYHPVIGRDALNLRSLEAFFPESTRRSSKYMQPEMARDIRSWLVEPDHAATQRKPLELNARQRELATSHTSTGYRRIKGPAGSGKSQVLAARAAELANEGNRVLVVSFNITLLNYLRDLAVRHPEPGQSRINQITWLNFHRWCRRVCEDAGCIDQYNALWRGTGATEDELDNSPILEKRLPQLVSRVIDQPEVLVTRYDAILVDEGQDFNLEWWNLLRKVLHHGGEMVLVADESQDIYGRARAWTDEAMNGAGFVGDWARLHGSYRLPERIMPLMGRYATEFLSDFETNLPYYQPAHPTAHRQSSFEVEPVKLRWIQTTPSQAVEASTWALLDAPRFADPWRISMSDFVLLTASRDDGRKCVEALRDKHIQTIHIFDQNWRKQRAKKLAFFQGDPRLKVCTIHSYKGWETRALVVHISKLRSMEDRALVYVALTRLKRHREGSVLTVVCAAPELEEYGKTWPIFEHFHAERMALG